MLLVTAKTTNDDGKKNGADDDDDNSKRRQHEQRWRRRYRNQPRPELQQNSTESSTVAGYKVEAAAERAGLILCWILKVGGDGMTGRCMAGPVHRFAI